MTKDAIEKRLDDIDNFIHNGLSVRIIDGVISYLNAQTVRRFRLFCRVLGTAIIVALVSSGVKILLF